MYLKIRFSKKNFRCTENIGYRRVKFGWLELYVQGTVLTKEYKKQKDIKLLKAINADIKNIPNYNGRFSGALINHKEKTVMLFSDRTGGGYLYYSIFDDDLYVSDKMQNLALLGIPLEENERAIATRLIYGYCLGKETYFKDVFTLRAGNAVKILLDKSVKELSTDAIFKQNITIKEPMEVIAKKVVAAMEESIVNMAKNLSKPLVATITGGLDSRLLLGIAAKNNLRIKSFCVDNDGGLDELRLAKGVGDFLGLEASYYPIDKNYYATHMDECYKASEYTCIMHVWFKPFEMIEELKNNIVMMGLGGGELLRINNGLARTQKLVGKDNAEIKEAILTNTLSISKYLRREYCAKIKNIASEVVGEKIDDYLASERGLRDFYLDARFFDAVDAIYAMYPNLEGLSPYLDSNVLNILYALPCTEEYTGDKFYELLYDEVSKELLAVDSTRTQDAKVNYFREKYAHSYESMRKVYDAFMEADDIIDVEKTKKIFEEKIKAEDYVLGQGEYWIYSYIKMREYVKELKKNS